MTKPKKPWGCNKTPQVVLDEKTAKLARKAAGKSTRSLKQEVNHALIEYYQMKPLKIEY